MLKDLEAQDQVETILEGRDIVRYVTFDNLVVGTFGSAG